GAVPTAPVAPPPARRPREFLPVPRPAALPTRRRSVPRRPVDLAGRAAQRLRVPPPPPDVFPPRRPAPRARRAPPPPRRAAARAAPARAQLPAVCSRSSLGFSRAVREAARARSPAPDPAVRPGRASDPAVLPVASVDPDRSWVLISLLHEDGDGIGSF